jgi:hypothetical protein
MLLLIHRTNYYGCGPVKAYKHDPDSEKPAKRSSGWQTRLPKHLMVYPRLLLQVAAHEKCVAKNNNNSIPYARKETDAVKTNGCCMVAGPRVINVDEGHFLRYHKKLWSLFLLRKGKNQIGHVYRQLILIPIFHRAPPPLPLRMTKDNNENINPQGLNSSRSIGCNAVKSHGVRVLTEQRLSGTVLDDPIHLQSYCNDLHEWDYVGDCQSCTMRLDLEHLLQPQLLERDLFLSHASQHDKSIKTKQFHIHIEVFMHNLHDLYGGNK